MDRPEAFIASYGLAPIPKISNEQCVSVISDRMLAAGLSESLVAKFARISSLSRIKFRNCALTRHHVGYAPSAKLEFLGRKMSELDKDEELLPDMKTLTAEQRAALWDKLAPDMCVLAAKCALDNWTDGTAADITHIVLSNTSGWREPGLAAHVIHALNLPLTTAKAELNFNGCFCGATCLRLARDIVRSGDAGERRAVLVIACEMPSIHTNETIVDITHFVAQSLFSDGAGAFIVSTSGDWRFTRAGMTIIPDSEHLLGLEPHGLPGNPRSSYYMTLHPDVSHSLADYFLKDAGLALLGNMLSGHSPAGTALAVHPGGPRILDSLMQPLKNVGFDIPNALADSYDTLANNGNLGSAASLYVLATVLDRLRKERSGKEVSSDGDGEMEDAVETEAVMMLAFGPGVTVEWGVLERAHVSKLRNGMNSGSTSSDQLFTELNSS